jgi:hypothetical protein
MFMQKTQYAMLTITKLIKEYGNDVIVKSAIVKSEKIP